MDSSVKGSMFRDVVVVKMQYLTESDPKNNRDDLQLSPISNSSGPKSLLAGDLFRRLTGTAFHNWKLNLSGR